MAKELETHRIIHKVIRVFLFAFVLYNKYDLKERKTMKKLALTLLMTTLTTGVVCVPAFAETVTFNGGHIYQAEQGKPGTIKLDLTNIDSQANVKMDTKELLTYLDDVKTANDTIYADEGGKTYSINSIVTDLNSKGGVPVYYASTMPVLTAEKPMTGFMTYWKGTDTTQATYSPKYYSLSDYIKNEAKAKVYTAKPDGAYLVAPGTTEKINKAGKYLFLVHDDGAISNSPVSIFCINVGETSTAATTTTAPTAKVTGWSKADGLWHYFDTNGAMKTGWLKDNGIWYYLDNSGAMKTGWLNHNGIWYYLNTDGSMAHDTVTPDGYTVGSDGALIK